MPKITLSFAADHAGFEMKQALIVYSKSLDCKIIDHGTHSTDAVDYPDYVPPVVGDILEGRATFGVLICGSGIGMDIAANRHAGIRSALCHNDKLAEMARCHNDANILCLGGRFITTETGKNCLKRFIATAFEAGGRHERRVEQLG
ncbi:MAG: ribose 5-phosphate isomerase B [Pseudomonadota bacterium]